MTTEIRYRRRRGARWRSGRLRTITANPHGPGLLVEVIDQRTGNARTLQADRWQLQLRNHRGRWVDATDWARSTRSLFEP